MDIKTTMLISGLKVLPKNQISWIFGKLASTKLPPMVNEFVINKFASLYHIDLSEAQYSVDYYESLNDFFTRKLKKEARPIVESKNKLASPADSKISQFGKIEKNKLIQIKGKEYTIESFLKDKEYAKKFYNGYYVTMYLSPQDYHRVHTPLDVEVDGYKYIKGKLFPVNAISVENINELFSINERVVFKLKNEQINEFALVMVGATNVGSISLSFDDLKTNKLIQKDIDKTYNKKPHLKKGEELGIFHMGSTVIMLFQKDSIKFEKLFINKKMKMGEEIATII